MQNFQTKMLGCKMRTNRALLSDHSDISPKFLEHQIGCGNINIRRITCWKIWLGNPFESQPLKICCLRRCFDNKFCFSRRIRHYSVFHIPMLHRRIYSIITKNSTKHRNCPNFFGPKKGT